MTDKKLNRIWIVIVAGLALCSEAPMVIAADDPGSPPTAGTAAALEQQEPAVHFETEGSYFLGYRWFSNEDSLKAAEYIYPHSSLTFGLDLLSCPLPYRYHVNAEFLNNYDFYTDAGFAYKDLVLFRDILVGIDHNLDHFNYQYAGETGLSYDEKNEGDRYDIDFASNLASLRLKAPDYPFHIFLIHRFVEQDGTVQQRFLLGDFGQLNKVSKSRDIDWQSHALKLGANSRVGPVELEYAYDWAEFDPGGNNILYDSYPLSTNFARPGDVYPHDVVPETESSANSIKLHSSYTGGIVAAATLSNLYQKNNYSGTDSTTWKGAVDFSWIPEPAVGLFFKYRHRDVDVDTPDNVTLTGLSNTLTYPVRQGISYDTDVFALSGRYRPLSILSLFATYEFSHLERSDIDEWAVLPGHSNVHRINFTAHAKPVDKVKTTATYEYKNYDQPAYNNTPDSSNKLRLTTTYTPTGWLNVYLEYILYLTERNSLLYLNEEPAVLLETGGRDGRRDQFLASLSTVLSPKASLTFTWYFQHWDEEQDLTYGKWSMTGTGDLPYIDAGVPYTDEFNSFSLLLQVMPREDITFLADLTYALSKGRSGYDDVVGGAPYALSSFSELKATETLLSVEVAKRFSSNWEIGLESHLNIYNDRAYDFQDGNAFTTIFKIRRYF